MTYLENNDAFLGTGEKNEAGKSLQEFLEAYNAKKYDNPCNTVDIAVFQAPEGMSGKAPCGGRQGNAQGVSNGALQGSNPVVNTGLKLLLIRRKNHPNIGYWALPGGFVELRENLEDSAKRELEEETGVTGVTPVQVRTWGDYDRDPRWRVITTLFCTVLTKPVDVEGRDDAADARWFDVSLEESVAEDGNLLGKLKLEDEKSGLILSAEASCSERGDGILSEDHWQLLDSERIAADHALLIIDAIRFIRERVKS